MTGNGEILNEAEVDFLLQGAGQDAEAPTPDLDDGNQTVTMHGDLDQISLADIFQTLAMSKMEGVLRVRNPLEERQVFCSDGYVRILVPSRLTLRRLGQRLIQAGLIAPDQLRSALVEQRKAKIPLGQLLVRDGIIAQDDLDEIIGMQVAEDLFALFTWRHGSFEFYKGDPTSEAIREKFASCPEYEVNSLLLEVARRSDEWESILEQLDSLDDIPRQIAQPDDPASLDETHEAVLAGCDGASTYRQLAEHTTFGLFEFARAARDLVAGGILQRIDDPALCAVAATLCDEGETQRAIVLLQTLRDRAGERSLGVIKSMAEVLEKAGERRLASQLLLEAAQRSPNAEEAIDLAREARALVPYDAGTLSFLRTVLVAHCEPDSPELEKVTLDLLDALIDGDLATTALEILEDARRTDTMRPPLLTREARARQKVKDVEGAAACMLELGEHYLAAGDRQKAVEALESVIRLDRSRKDVQRQVAALKRTRTGQLVRVAAMIAVVLMVGAMGFVWWQQQRFDDQLQAATVEVQELLDQGDREGARQAFERHRQSLGDCPAIQDLGSRVSFAEAAERNRLAKLERGRINERLTEAAQALGRGELRGSFTIYTDVHGERGMSTEVEGIVSSRLDAMLEGFARTSKSLTERTPEEPDQLLDRAALTRNLAELQRLCPPATARCYEELDALVREGALPAFITKVQRTKIQEALDAAHDAFAEAGRISNAYARALERNDNQRRLDPLFKAAVAKEQAHDFAGALELYRELEQQPTGDAELRAHFRDRVTRNATITRLLRELGQATDAGDYDTAQQHLRALRRSFEEVPFDELCRLPLRVTSEPPGAVVRVGDEELGRTPLTLSRVPAEEVSVVVVAPEFDELVQAFQGDAGPEWVARLARRPAATWSHESAVENAPVVTADGDRVAVDRGGRILKRSGDLRAGTWELDSDDLSGWLTAPILAGDVAVVASLDGPLRAVDLQRGTVAWKLDDLPCEVQPVLVDSLLALATTDARLHAIDLAERRRTSVDLGEIAHGKLLQHRGRVVVIGQQGTISCYALPSLERAWRRPLGSLAGPHAECAGDLVVVGDDQGHLRALDARTGELVWKRDLEVTTLGSFAIGGDAVVLATTARLLRFDLATGKDLAPFGGEGREWAGHPTVAGDRLIVPLRNGPLQVLDVATGAARFRLPGDARSRVLVASDGSVFVSHEDHSVDVYGRLP